MFRRTIVGSNFDSVLDFAQPGRAAKLTIRLKVALLPRDPSVAANPATGPHPVHIANTMAQTHHGQIADYNNNLVSCRSWLTTEWNAFKIKFKKVGEQEWNNQMILLPPLNEEDGAKLSDNDFRHLMSNPNIPAHVECALDIELMPTAAGSHAQIEVVHLAAPQWPFRNFSARGRPLAA